ncbi:BRISC and BRCA1-A complex member 1 [Gossypium australe]|uniref:BRISC and BRCA1-A complex member 1 n=1 Tax=Gossypium australe TaxID=47621 RepID=A0A5B6W8D6_9ROSI|nr:BRISC and BRCA1-A complex member 1 [Gossypium australe]
MKMEGIKGDASVGEARLYILNLTRINNKDDVDTKSLVEMKTAGITILDSINQAILLFVNSKLSINPDHCFAFATLSKTASWLRKEFGSDVESTIAIDWHYTIPKEMNEVCN